MDEPITASAKRYSCPSCGGGLRYIPGRQIVQCQMCSNEFYVFQFSNQDDEPLDDEIDVESFTCPQCGATLVSGSTEATSFCAFCGSDVVLTRRMTRMRCPDLIVPFTLSREACEDAYRTHLRKYHFAPSSLRRQETISRFQAVYIPFWAYDVEMNGQKRYIIRQIKGDVEETREMEVELDYKHNGILFDASSAFEDETAARLSHSLKKAVSFHPLYLSGMYAQMADVGPEVYENEARASASISCAKHVMSKLRCNEVRFPDQKQGGDLAEAKVSAKLVLLPVWLLAKKSGGRVLYTAVNGEDGHVVCDPPLSPVKVGALTAVIAALLFFILYLMGSIALHHMMLATAAVMLTTLRLMTPVYRERLFRERREAEPDFSKESPYFGEMQSRLRESLGVNLKGLVPRKNKVVKEGVKKAITITLYFILRIGLRFLIGMFGLFIYWLGTATYELAIVLVSAYWILSIIRSCRMLVRFPAREQERVFLSGVMLIHLLAVVMVALAIIQPARDLIYYLVVVAGLGFTVGIQLLMIGRQNRFATRPVPFFGEEENA